LFVSSQLSHWNQLTEWVKKTKQQQNKEKQGKTSNNKEQQGKTDNAPLLS
jgi:hypothetical protein